MFIDYWETDAGISPVFDFMHRESAKTRARIQWVIDYFEVKDYSLMGTPFLKKLRGGLYELRVQVYRILLVIKKTTAYLLHAFVKKTRKTPSKEMQTALARKTILESRLSMSIC